MTTHSHGPDQRRKLSGALRAIGRLLLRAALGVLVIALLLLLLLQTRPGATMVGRLALAVANPWSPAVATLGSAGGSWLSSLELRQVRIENPASHLLMTIDTLRASYSLAALFEGTLRFETLELRRPVVRTGPGETGSWALLEPFEPSEGTGTPSDTSGAPLSIECGRLTVSDGEFTVVDSGGTPRPPFNVAKLRLEARAIRIAGSAAFTIDSLRADLLPGPPESGPAVVELAGAMTDSLVTVSRFLFLSPGSRVTASGTVALLHPYPGFIPPGDWIVEATPVAYADLARFTSGIGPRGSATARFSSRGGSDQARVEAVVEIPGGGSLTLASVASWAESGKSLIALTLRTQDLSLAGLTGPADSSEHVTADLEVHGTGLTPEEFSGELQIRARRSMIGGIGPFDLDLRSSAEKGVLRPELRATYENLALSLSGNMTPFDEVPVFAAAGTVDLGGAPDLSSTNPLRRLAGLASSFRCSGSGFDPSSAAATLEISGRWADHPRAHSVTVSASLREAAASVVAGLATHGGNISLTGGVRLDPAIAVRLDSLQFERFDLALLLGESARSRLTGSLSASATLGELSTLQAEVSGDFRHSSYGPFDIHSAQFRANAARGELAFRGLFETSAGSLAAESLTVRVSEGLSVNAPRLEFRSLDIGTFTESSGIRSSLNGVLSLRGRADSREELARVLRGLPPLRDGAVDAEVHLALQPSRFESQPIESATLVATAADRDLRLTADLRIPNGGLSLEADARRLADSLHVRVPSARFRRIDLGALTGTPSVRTSLSGSLSLDAASGAGGSPTGTVSLDLEDSRINRERIHRAAIRGSAGPSGLALEAGAEMDNGRMDVDVAFAREGEAYRGGVRADLRLAKAAGILGIDSSIAASIAFGIRSEGTLGPPEQTRFRGWVGGMGTLDTLRADSVRCDFLLSGRTLSVDTLLVLSNAGTVSGCGDLALLDSTEASDFTVSAEITSAGLLRYLLPEARSSLRGARIDLSVTGRSPETKVEAQATFRSAGVEDLFAEEIRITGQGGIGPDFSLLELSARADAVEISYEETTAHQATLAVHSLPGRHQINAFVHLDEGRFVRGAGTLRTAPDSTVIDIDTLSFTSARGVWALEGPARIALGRRLEVSGLSLRNGPRSIAARGHLDPAGTQDLFVRIDSVSLSDIGKFVNRRDLDGVLSLSVAITGPAQAATAGGTLQAEFWSSASDTVRLAGDLDWRESTLVTRARLHGAGSPVEAAAKFARPLSIASLFGRGTPDTSSFLSSLDSLMLDVNRFDVSPIQAFLNQKSIRQLRGLVSARISGARIGTAFPVSGSLAIDSGLVELPSLGVTYGEIGLRAALKGDSIRFDGLHVASGAGTLDGSGTLHLTGEVDRPGSLHFLMDRFLAVQTLNVKATLSGDLHLAGPRGAPKVWGALRLDDSYYYLESTGGEGSVEQVELTDADYATLREKFGYVKFQRAVAAPGAMPDVTADLAVTLERNNWIRKRSNPTLAVELDGTLDIGLKPRNPIRIVGTLRPVAGRSYVGQFGRQFEVTSGEIILTGNLGEIELGVDSEYRVKSTSGSGLTEVTLMMRVEGRMGRYAFRLTSDPPMSEPEILQYLATGRASTGALARTNDGYNMGSAAALEQVVGVAGSLTEGKLPFDVFQIRQDGARGVIIVAGNYVTPKSYLGVRQPIILDASSQSTYYKEQTQFEFEYETLPWLFLNFQGGSSRLLLLLKGRYAY